MNAESVAILKALFSSYPADNGTDLTSFLPEDRVEKLKEYSFAPKSKIATLLSEKEALKKIHYSWIAESLPTLPKATLSLFLTCLTPEQALSLKELLDLPSPPTLSPMATLFLRHFLKKKIQKKDVLPLELLPPSATQDLLKLSRAKILRLINLLGVQDLAIDLRYVLDKNLLSKVYAALSDEELQFLHYFTKQPIKWVPERLHIEKWNGEKKTLLSLIHRRGLSRFAKALQNENESFKWHLIHFLDTGRGKVCMKLWAEKEDPLLTPYFQAQLLMLLKRFSK